MAMSEFPAVVDAQPVVHVLGEHRMTVRYVLSLLAAAGCPAEAGSVGSASRDHAAGSDVVIIDTAHAEVPWVDLVPGRRVVALVPADGVDVMTLLAHGVHAVVAEDRVDEDLVTALGAAVAGLVSVSASLLGPILLRAGEGDRARSQARLKLAQLGDREIDLLKMIGMGLSNSDIGAARHIAGSTVKVQVRDLLRRLGGCTRFQAALLAAECGLCDDSGDAALSPGAKNIYQRTSRDTAGQ